VGEGSLGLIVSLSARRAKVSWSPIADEGNVHNFNGGPKPPMAGAGRAAGKVLQPFTTAGRVFWGQLEGAEMQKPREIRGFCALSCFMKTLL
jgi:hypothetical protein